MQTYSSSSSLAETVFFTSTAEETQCYLVMVDAVHEAVSPYPYVLVRLYLNGVLWNDVNWESSNGGSQAILQGTLTPEGVRATFPVRLAQGDELSLSVEPYAPHAWSVELRLAHLADELAPLE